MNLGSIEYLILYNLQEGKSKEFKNINLSLNNSITISNYYAAFPRVFFGISNDNNFHFIITLLRL